MLITLDTLKDFLKISNNNQDDLLTSAINQATSFIQNYTWRNLEAKDYTEIRDWRGEREVVLKDYPVNSFTSYSYNSWTIGTPVWDSYSTDDYWVNKEEGILRSLFFMNKWIQNNQLVYNAWYTDIPDDLQRACIRIASYLYSWAWKIKQGVKKESVDGASIEYDTTGAGIETEVYSILDTYKTINV